MEASSSYGEAPVWEPQVPRIRLLPLLFNWLTAAASLYVAAWVLSGVELDTRFSAFLVAALIGVVNAVLPPIVAGLRLPFTVALGFVLILLIDAGALWLAADVFGDLITIDSFGDAFLAALIMAATMIVLSVIAGTNDDDEYALRVVSRVARRQGSREETSAPGLIMLEIDGLALPVLQHAMSSGSAPNMARWLSEGGYELREWETDLSSQTGASQAGILLGCNENIPAFRWVEKESGDVVACSNPDDCAEIERRCTRGLGILSEGGASRGNLLSGEAEETILTVSRIDADKRANPGYRAFLANGFNVTRSLVLFINEVALELIASGRAKRRDVRPRGRRGGTYPLLRGVLCVIIRDLIVYGVLSDMMRGRPAVYATFSSYDEVAHHSGLERADTMEALRKLDQQFGRIMRARRFAPRPYEIVVLSDHGQTQGATFKQRNGYGLDELVERSMRDGAGVEFAGGDEQDAVVGHALAEARSGDGHDDEDEVEAALRAGDTDRHAIVLGSGNLGLIYLMEEKRRLTMEEIDERHPELLGALREHPHVGWIMVRSGERGAVVLGGDGANWLAEGRVEGDDPLAPFAPTAALHLLRTDGFDHVADIMVGSFYDDGLEEGCAFEELISFHGGLGGPQTRAFLLHPETLAIDPDPLVGAESVNRLLWRWREQLHGARAPGADSTDVPGTGAGSSDPAMATEAGI